MAVATKKQNKTKRKKRRLKKKVKKRGMIFILLLVTLTLFFPIKSILKLKLHPAPIGTVKVDRFRDLNAVHLKHAKANGIQAFKTEKDFSEGIGELLKEGLLEEISDNRYYRICELTHSHPYLTPEAKDFLAVLGKNFKNKLDDANKKGYYFQISSLLRTVENQKQLSRTNGNASPNSSHYYGTTFDIPYFTVIKKTLLWNEAEVMDGMVSKLLSEAIGEHREEGRCVVVTEKNERCFHITVKNKFAN